jgi:putative flippase GtrA
MFTFFTNLTKRGIAPFLQVSFQRYLIIGVGTFVLDNGLYWLFINAFNMYYLWANIAEFPFVFAFNFFGHKLFTFENTYRPHEQLVKYIVLVIVNAVIGNFLLYLYVDIIGLHYMIGKFAMIGTILTWNFIALDKFVYSDRLIKQKSTP